MMPKPTPKPPTRPGTYPTTHTCRVCKEGKLVEVFAFQTHHDPLMRRSSYMKRMSVHCALCGVAYGKLPEEPAYMPADGAVQAPVPDEPDRPGISVAEATSRKSKITERDFVDRVEHIIDALGEGSDSSTVRDRLYAYVTRTLASVEGHGLEGLMRRGRA